MLETSRIDHAGLYTGEHCPVPLQDITISVAVLDAAAEVTLTQTYKNTESAPVEAMYCFPMEYGAAVYRFEAKTDDRTIRGSVEEREKAFERYDEAIADGSGAVLLDREQEDIFVASVGNLMPGQEIEVCIGYAAELPVSDDLIHVIIPATVSPRYIPPGYDPVKADVISPPAQTDVPYRLSLQVAVHDAGSVSGISSPSHNITIDRTDECWSVSLAHGTTCLDRDFILDIRHRAPKAPRAVIQQHENGDRAIMMRLYPEFDAQKQAGPQEVVFMLDCSGSMSGTSIQKAKRVLELCIRSMSQGDYFNIIRFGSTFTQMWSQSMQYCDNTFESALAYIRRIDADMGGTELVPALGSVITEQSRPAGVRNVFLITDGQIANEDEAVSLARLHRDATRIFTFGIGYGTSMSLVKGLAAESGGMAEFVSPDEHMEEKVLRQFSRFDAPCIQDITINWNGAKIKQSPADPPPLFSGDSFTLYGLIEAGTPAQQVELTGMCGGSEIQLSAPVTETSPGNMIPLLWAKHAVRDLETGTDAGSRQKARNTVRRKEKIIELAKRYQLLSSETSFVAVETRTDTGKATQRPLFRQIPIELTRGWHGNIASPMNISQGITGKTFSENMDTCSFLVNEEQSMSNEEADFAMECPACMSDVSDSQSAFESERLSPSSPMYELLLAQTPEGWFEPTELLCSYINTSMDNLKEISSRIEGVESDHDRLRVLSTALTIIVLQEREAARKDIWDRAAKKAAAVLHSRAPDAVLDGKPVIDQVRELFFS